MAGHNGNFAPRQNGFDLAEELHTRKVGEPQVGYHDVGRLCFERKQRRFGTFGLGASESEVGPDGHTEAADALLIIYNQKADAQFVAHGFPKVLSTTEMSCWTRKGFSTQGVPLRSSKAIVSVLAVSPLMRIMRERSWGRCC